MAGTLGDAYVNIIPKAPGISNEIEDLISGGAEAGGKAAGGKVGSGLLSTLGKVVSVAAVGKIVKDAFAAGGNLEQSFGGLETIYGDAAAGAKQYAMEAAAAGISANSYAEQAVSFGAALKQAFKGDTEKAMQAANTAIMDMADNSAKMGTDINAVQSAYQGFAKQNYTMLDNLKLGYGGTKTEMERLLADATKLSGVKYDIDNLGDVYDAIHVIQENLGLTGVAAAEAETTLTGSFGAVKASFQNLLAAMTTGEGLDKAMQNLGQSAGNLLKNVIRMLGNLARQLPALLSGIFTTIGPELIPAATGIVQGLLTGITTQLPQLLSGGMTMLQTLIQGIFSALPGLISTAGQFIPTLISGFLPQIPELLAQGVELLQQLIAGIVQTIPTLLSTAAEVVTQLITGIGEHLPEILEQGITLLGELAAGVIEGIGTLISTVPQIFSDFGAAMAGVDWASLGRSIIDGIISGLKNAASSLWSAIRNIIRQGLNAGKDEAAVGSPSRLFADEIGRWIPAGVAVGIKDNLEPVNQAMSDLVQLASSDMARGMQPGMTAARQPEKIDYNRLAEAISSRPVVIQGDTARIFKVVRNQNKIITKSTNWNALGAATT